MKLQTPLVKGFLTGLIMVLFSIFMGQYATDDNVKKIQLVVYALFALGTVWTVWSYFKLNTNNPSFGAAFSYTFKYFVVVVLCMVVFVFIYLKMHPKLVEEAANFYISGLKKGGQLTPDEINTQAANFKKHYHTFYISTAIFGYLLFGAFASAVTIGLFKLIRKK